MATRKAPAGPLTAYVLHSWDWSETSLIVELFTRERGRVVAAAKGAKRATSQLRPVLLPFQRLQVQLGRASADETSEIQVLRSAEWAGGATMPPGAALFAGFYLNELLLKLSARQDPHAALFDAYAQTLEALGGVEGDAGVQLSLRAFELRLLRELGLLPDLACATLTLEPLQPRASYALHPESGVVASARNEGVLSGEQWVHIEAALVHGGQDALRQAARPATAALKGVLRQLLQYHLGAPMLRTRQLMADIQKLADADRKVPRR